MTISLIPHNTPEQLRSAIAPASDEKHKTRLRAILQIQQGTRRCAVAAHMVIDVGTLGDWVTLYNAGGTEALRLSHGGRPPGTEKWSSSLFAALATEIDTKKGYWSIPMMQDWLHTVKGVDIPEQTVWYRMDKLKYSYKSGRPCPVQGDSTSQEGFKKGGLHRSWSR